METFSDHLARFMSVASRPAINEQAMNTIAMIAMLLGLPHEQAHQACCIVASHSPAKAAETLERLYCQLSGNQVTDLTRDFYQQFAFASRG